MLFELTMLLLLFWIGLDLICFLLRYYGSPSNKSFYILLTSDKIIKKRENFFQSLTTLARPYGWKRERFASLKEVKAFACCFAPTLKLTFNDVWFVEVCCDGKSLWLLCRSCPWKDLLRNISLFLSPSSVQKRCANGPNLCYIYWSFMNNI